MSFLLHLELGSCRINSGFYHSKECPRRPFLGIKFCPILFVYLSIANKDHGRWTLSIVSQFFFFSFFADKEHGRWTLSIVSVCLLKCTYQTRITKKHLETNEMMMNKWMEHDLREWMSSIQDRLSVFCKEYRKPSMLYQLKIDK